MRVQRVQAITDPSELETQILNGYKNTMLLRLIPRWKIPLHLGVASRTSASSQAVKIYRRILIPTLHARPASNGS